MEEEPKRSRDELEALVAQRTAELVKINEQLHKEINDRREIESALRIKNSAIESSINAIALAELEGNLTYVNKAFLALWGYTDHSEVLGRPVAEFWQSREKAWEIVESLRKSGRYMGELVAKRKDETYFHVQLMASMVKDGAGNPICMMGSFSDISERKQAEEEKKKLQMQLQQAQKMEAIASLAGGIAHQFNNALVGIAGNIELLKNDFPEDERISKYTEPIKASVGRVAHLTNQLLAYARGGKYDPRKISLVRFVEDTLPLIQPNIDPAIRVETDLPFDSCMVEADLTQLQMVFSSVVANGAEAIEGHGRIRISVSPVDVVNALARKRPGLGPGKYFCLSVTDDGKGMDEETRRRIFEPFFTTKFQGRGLGMAAVYGIIKSHDGWISVDSERGKGTLVQIYLPAIEAPAEDREASNVEVIRGKGTVLVIEDEQMVREVCQAMLERLGYHVLTARNGKEAVELGRSFGEEIDLGLLDIVLPDMSAKEIYASLMELRPRLKVIVCSGYALDGPAQEILNAGAQGFLQKPYSLGTLSAKLKEVSERP